MKLSWYHSMLVIGVVTIFYTNVPEFLHRLDPANPQLLPKNWVIAFSLAAVPVLLRQQAVLRALQSPMALWCLGYLWIGIVWFIPFSQTEDHWHDLRLRFLAVIELMVFAMILSYPAALQLGRRLLVGAVLWGVTLNVYEMFVPGTFSEVFGRSAGLYRNPNLSGEALLLGMILGTTALPPRYRTVFVLLTGLGILVTLSRANILAWGLAVAAFIIFGHLRRKELVISLFGTLGVGLLLFLPRLDQFMTAWETAGLFNRDVLQRLEWFTDPLGVLDGSSWSREQVAQKAWERFAQAPFFGSGTGSSHDEYPGTHNQYLSFMVDHGIIGAAILPVFLVTLLRPADGPTRQIGQIFVVSVLVLAFGTHTLLTNEHSLFLFSLMGAMAAVHHSGVSALEGNGHVLSPSAISTAIKA